MAALQHESGAIDALVDDIRKDFAYDPAVLWFVEPSEGTSSLRTYGLGSENYLLLAGVAVNACVEFVRQNRLAHPFVIHGDQVGQLTGVNLAGLDRIADLVVYPIQHAGKLTGMFVVLCKAPCHQQPERVHRFPDLKRAVISFLFGGHEIPLQDDDTVYLGEGILGRSAVMRKVMADVRSVAASDLNVFIIGESGTGKELIARYIHKMSPRAAEAFIPVDPVALPAQLLESELFGHEKGAFTGATYRKPGLFEFANKGTLFLDEICELQFDLQAKLLRALQEKEFRRVGGHKLIDVDVRLISATNRDPEEAVRDRRLREDLFYRLNGVPIHVPPLRQRREDIPLLVQHFADEFTKRRKEGDVVLTEEAIECLCEYDWPGNVRELQHVVERLITLSPKDVITVADLPPEILRHQTTTIQGGADAIAGLPLEEARRRKMALFERDYLCDLLQRYRGNISQVARAAGTSRKTIYQILKRHDISHLEFKSSSSHRRFTT